MLAKALTGTCRLSWLHLRGLGVPSSPHLGPFLPPPLSPHVGSESEKGAALKTHTVLLPRESLRRSSIPELNHSCSGSEGTGVAGEVLQWSSWQAGCSEPGPIGPGLHTPGVGGTSPDPRPEAQEAIKADVSET